MRSITANKAGTKLLIRAKGGEDMPGWFYMLTVDNRRFTCRDAAEQFAHDTWVEPRKVDWYKIISPTIGTFGVVNGTKVYRVRLFHDQFIIERFDGQE